MGKTEAMKRHERMLRKRNRDRERIPAVEVLTEEMAKGAGLDTTTQTSWTGGTSGLSKKEQKDKARKLLTQ